MAGLRKRRLAPSAKRGIQFWYRPREQGIYPSKIVGWNRQRLFICTSVPAPKSSQERTLTARQSLREFALNASHPLCDFPLGRRHLLRELALRAGELSRERTQE